MERKLNDKVKEQDKKWKENDRKNEKGKRQEKAKQKQGRFTKCRQHRWISIRNNIPEELDKLSQSFLLITDPTCRPDLTHTNESTVCLWPCAECSESGLNFLTHVLNMELRVIRLSNVKHMKYRLPPPQLHSETSLPSK